MVRYGREVAGPEWDAMDDGGSSRAVFGLIGEMFSTLGTATTTTPTQETFLADALVRLNELAQDRAERITVAEEGQVSILWVAIIVGGVLTVGFALLFGVSNERLHYLMVGGLRRRPGPADPGHPRAQHAVLGRRPNPARAVRARRARLRPMTEPMRRVPATASAPACTGPSPRWTTAAACRPSTACRRGSMRCALTDWFVARWGSRSFDVRPGYGHRRATADEHGVLQMPKWARTELVLLHEVAHCLTPWTFAGHGPEYAGVLLTLARRGMGPATAQRMEDAFARERVRWTLSAVPEVRPSVANAQP